MCEVSLCTNRNLFGFGLRYQSSNSCLLFVVVGAFLFVFCGIFGGGGEEG